MSKKPWEDKVSEEESEEVVDADFLDDEDEFEDFEEEGNTSSDEDQEKSGFINSSFLTVLLSCSYIVVCMLFFVFYTSSI
ncbi:Putative membrane associated protein [Streptococcus thermophilus CNCM I-1630]|nr:Putative membrane associated protein [Streptococcus thermophilus CNCM I-1630]